MSGIEDDPFKRLVLINQYTILSHVDRDGREEWERAASKVRSHWPIDDLPGVPEILSAQRDPFTEEDRDLVYGVLAMHEVLQNAENERVVAPDGKGAVFEGFDGNGETKYMSYTRSLIKHEGKWEYLRTSNKDFNAHRPTLETYGRMLEAWDKQGRPINLTAAEYAAIQAARIHPENRT